MAESGDKIIRETFELVDIPEIVAACPDPGLRTVLRGVWQQDAEKRYPEYRERAERLGTKELFALRAELQGVLATDRFEQLLSNQPEGEACTGCLGCY